MRTSPLRAYFVLGRFIVFRSRFVVSDPEIESKAEPGRSPMSSKKTARTNLGLVAQSPCRGQPARSIGVEILPLFFFRRQGEKDRTTTFQIKTFTAIRVFEQTFHFLRSRDQIVHFSYLALRE